MLVRPSSNIYMIFDVIAMQTRTKAMCELDTSPEWFRNVEIFAQGFGSWPPALRDISKVNVQPAWVHVIAQACVLRSWLWEPQLIIELLFWLDVGEYWLNSIFSFAYICIYGRLYTYIYIHIFIYIYTYICICIYVYVYVDGYMISNWFWLISVPLFVFCWCTWMRNGASAQGPKPWCEHTRRLDEMDIRDS